jgi:signal transduction histidine kinase
MSLRSAVITGLFSVTLLVGAFLIVNGITPNLKDPFRRYQPRDPISHGRTENVSRAPSEVPHKLHHLAELFAANNELLSYAAIVLFGILMMGLAIGSASAKPKEKTDRLVELLRQEKDKAENLARLKAEFLNQVSHELRTPLAVIIGYIECITDGLYGEIEAKHQEILQIVAKQSGHLKNMIDQILIYSRLEANKQPVRIEDFQLNKIVTDLRDTFEFLCRQKGIELRWELIKEPALVRTDFERVKEVLSNLLQNAIKYTGHGTITVRLRRVTATDSIIIEVADTGVGIPEHYLSSIFDPFMQVHKTSSENSKGGIGLGLSIVKKHLEQLKGNIAVESELGKGSTFRIILPRLYDGRSARRKRLFELVKHSFRQSRTLALSNRPSVTTVKEVNKTGQAVG